jgi:hypothetical protein
MRIPSEARERFLLRSIDRRGARRGMISSPTTVSGEPGPAERLHPVLVVLRLLRAVVGGRGCGAAAVCGGRAGALPAGEDNSLRKCWRTSSVAELRLQGRRRWR